MTRLQVVAALATILGRLSRLLRIPRRQGSDLDRRDDRDDAAAGPLMPFIGGVISSRARVS
jgi:hypothetical protein